MLSVLSIVAIKASGNVTEHAWNVITRHVLPATAMRNLTNRKLVGIGCARLVVTHRALAVAEQDLELITAKTMQWK